MKTPALYALSADPLTLGHTGVITQSLQTNDLLIAIAGNDTKSPLFDQWERIRLTQGALKGKITSDRIIGIQGSVVHAMQHLGIKRLVRWIRNSQDTLDEATLHFFNTREFPGLETTYMKPSHETEYISSSGVKSALRAGHRIDGLVHFGVKHALESRILEQYRINITGETGAGKSHISRSFQDIGRAYGVVVHIIDTDTIGHRIYDSLDTPYFISVRERIREAFPDIAGLTLLGGKINRSALRIVFTDAQKRDTLNHIMKEAIEFQIGQELIGKKGIILIDGALSIDFGTTHFANHSVVLVTAETELRVERLLQRNKNRWQVSSRAEIQAQIAAQKPTSEKRSLLLHTQKEATYGSYVELCTSHELDQDLEAQFFKMLEMVDLYGEIRAGIILRKLWYHGNISELVVDLRKRHNAPGRHYHTWEHIRECLDALGQLKGKIPESDFMHIGGALLFHDLIQGSSTDIWNEVASGQEMERLLSLGWVTPETSMYLKTLIQVTESHDIKTPQEAILSDIDMSILAREASRYTQYTSDIWREWSHIGKEAYRTWRTQFIQRLLERGQIFHSEFFQSYERKARENLEKEYESLANDTFAYN